MHGEKKHNFIQLTISFLIDGRKCIFSVLLAGIICRGRVIQYLMTNQGVAHLKKKKKRMRLVREGRKEYFCDTLEIGVIVGVIEKWSDFYSIAELCC